MVRRWPTWLALLLTIDYWLAPSAPPAWNLLQLPLGYLVIGGLRRQLGPAGQLALQLAGFAGYLVLVLVAYTVNEDLARYLVGAGWLAHAVWGVAHFRINRVVPRAYAECCAMLDTVIGLAIIFLDVAEIRAMSLIPQSGHLTCGLAWCEEGCSTGLYPCRPSSISVRWSWPARLSPVPDAPANLRLIVPR